MNVHGSRVHPPTTTRPQAGPRHRTHWIPKVPFNLHPHVPRSDLPTSPHPPPPHSSSPSSSSPAPSPSQSPLLPRPPRLRLRRRRPLGLHLPSLITSSLSRVSSMASQLWRSSSYADPRSAASQYSHAIIDHRSPRSARRRKSGLPEFVQLDRTGTSPSRSRSRLVGWLVGCIAFPPITKTMPSSSSPPPLSLAYPGTLSLRYQTEMAHAGFPAEGALRARKAGLATMGRSPYTRGRLSEPLRQYLSMGRDSHQVKRSDWQVRLHQCLSNHSRKRSARAQKVHCDSGK